MIARCFVQSANSRSFFERCAEQFLIESLSSTRLISLAPCDMANVRSSSNPFFDFNMSMLPETICKFFPRRLDVIRLVGLLPAQMYVSARTEGGRCYVTSASIH